MAESRSKKRTKVVYGEESVEAARVGTPSGRR